MQFRYLAFFLAAASAMASEHHHHRHHRHHDAEESCTNVSVEGDSTYCIRGPICSGSTNSSGACPKKGDTAVANCVSNIPSYVSAGVCKAKRDAVCTKLKTGAFGCAYPRAETEVMAADAEAACTNVSVQGDATYCIDGPICGGNGDKCPKKGDKAVADCLPNLKSYANGGCVAPADAVCQTIASGARGCVFGATPAPTPVTTPAGCTNVSVEGDGTYCITGPICSGSTDGSGACPKKGDPVVANCVSNIPSYVSGSCSAPRDAKCVKLKTGAFGCAFAPVEAEVQVAAAETVDVVEQACTNVSVQGDATYCVKGAICGDAGDQCPKKGDKAVQSCVAGIPSFANGNCVAPSDGVCQVLRPGGPKGCVFGAPSATPSVTPSVTPASTPATDNSKVCAENWSQCNGQNWPFGVCCKNAGWKCVKHNDYYSQCLQG